MSAGPENLTIVEAARVLPDATLPLIDNGAVLVKGEQIVAVGPLDEVMAMSDEPFLRVRLGDVTLLPGLIDCHVHLGYESALGSAHRQSPVRELDQFALMLFNARKLVRAGVTTIRELGSFGVLGSVVRDTIARGWAIGPRVLAANQPLTTTGGHAWFLGGECDSSEEIRKSVRNHHKDGADLIKVMVTGGGLTSGSVPWRAQFTLDEISALVQEATRLRMPVAAHVHGTEGIDIAAKSGVTTIEHCTWMGEGSVIGGDLDLAVLDEIVARGIFVCPTASSRWEAMTAERRSAKIETVAKMHEAGVRIVAGTDAGIEYVPHEGYAHGLEWLSRCGMSTKEVIAAATSVAAQACGIADITGTISGGKSADMVAVRGNPLEDLGVLGAPAWVMARGQTLVGQDLSLGLLH